MELQPKNISTTNTILKAFVRRLKCWFLRRSEAKNIFLPEDIIFNILLRCPVKSLVRFRCVSKFWFDLITNPNFIKIQLDYSIQNDKFNLLLTNSRLNGEFYSIAYDPSFCFDQQEVIIKLFPDAKIVGSCNGLICIVNTCCFEYPILFNPSTTEYKEIPSPPLLGEETSCLYCFGYDHVIDDYKLITFVSLYPLKVSKVQVYTLGSNSWRTNPSVIPYDFNFGWDDHIPVVLNGYFHWFLPPYTSIISFDIVKEIFNELPVPANYSYSAELFLTNVSALRGSLCLLKNLNKDGIEFWEMKEYGVVESWTKMFITSPTNVYHSNPIELSKNGEILLDIHGGDIYEDSYPEDGLYMLVSSDGEPQKGRLVKVHSTFDKEAETTYVDSLVSLNSHTYLGNNMKLCEEKKCSGRYRRRKGGDFS